MKDTVLIIEDTPSILENMAEILEVSGYLVLKADNGIQGIEIAKTKLPDIILCDIMMSKLDGYGVLRAIENIPDLQGRPFVFVTAKSEKGDFRHAMDLGADDYLTKPFSGDELLRVVSSRLKKSKMLKTKFSNTLEGLDEFMNEAGSLKDIKSLSEKRTVKKFRKKEPIYLEGDSPNFLFFIVSGKIKTFKTNELGKEYILNIYKEGDFFGHIPLLDDREYRESAMAIEDSKVALIPKQEFFQLLHSNKEVSMKFIKFMSNDLSETEEKLLNLAYNSARKRVAEALLFIFRKYAVEGENKLTFPANRENISALAGISPESVSRNLSDFREEGLIDTGNGTIIIADFRKLEAIKN